MTDHSPDHAERAAQIAARLTKGQALCIRDAAYRDPRAYGVEGYEVTGRSANSLSLKGLAYGREFRSLSGKGRRGIALTPLGLAVRAALTDTVRGEGEKP